MPGDCLQMTVALRWRRLARCRGHAWRRHHGRVSVSLGDVYVDTILVIGTVSGERRHRHATWSQQGTNLGGIVDLLAGQARSHDLAGDGIHTQMQLPPRPARPGAMLSR
jgi:hypothetical protein